MISDPVQEQEQTPDRRTVYIEALDGNGAPAGAEIGIFIDGMPAGVLDLGTGAQHPATLELDDLLAEITLVARFLGQTETIVMYPGDRQATFQFHGSVQYGVARKAEAFCPDGSHGSPCVTCRAANGKTWRMCC